MWWQLIYWITTLAILAWSLFTPSGRSSWGWFFNNIVGGALSQATPLVNQLGPDLELIYKSFSNAVNTHSPALTATLGADFQKVAAAVLEAQRDALKTIGESTPENALDSAAQAFKVAFGAGLTSAGIAALFEAVFPEKLNTLNGVAPMIAKMAGFDEVAAEVIGPLYKNAFGRSLEYQYRSLFKPELPSEDDAVTWHARRLLSDAQLRTLFGFSGLKAEYEDPFVASAYRGLQPRALANMIQDSPFPAPEIRSALEFAGLRPADIDFMMPVLEWNSTKNVRQQYLAAAVRSTELGTMTPADLDGVLDDLKYSDDAKGWVQLTVATRKLEQLAELYRKSVSEAYAFGQITDANYVSSLEAIGIGEADANAHYAIDSIKKHGKDLLAAQRAEAHLEAARTRAAVQAAIEGFKTFTLDAAGLEAALLLAGLDPAIATYSVTTQELRRDGVKVFLYGLELPRAAAVLLRANVSALETQTKDLLVTPQEALNRLNGYGIAPDIAFALVAKWSAVKAPKA